jgi:hypothetical protein
LYWDYKHTLSSLTHQLLRSSEATHQRCCSRWQVVPGTEYYTLLHMYSYQSAGHNHML